MLIGVISDTHGKLRPEALAALAGCDRILHAGDIGGPEILESLSTIAPVTAVRGNNDTEAWAENIPEHQSFALEGVRIFMLHDLKTLDDSMRTRHDVVIAGHSHKPRIEERDGVLYLNPGSAGPRRFSLPVSVAHLRINEGQAVAEIVELDVAPAKKGRT